MIIKNPKLRSEELAFVLMPLCSFCNTMTIPTDDPFSIICPKCGQKYIYHTKNKE